MRAFLLTVALASSCGKSAAPAAQGGSGSDPWAATPRLDAAPASGGCEARPFATSLPVSEASGAAFLELDDLSGRSMIVVGDSGNRGEYILIDPATGDVRERGHLPLPDGISDDIEGIASPDARTVYGLVSDGTLLTWKRAHAAFALTGTARIGDERDRNYEGLCLAPRPSAGACDGFAASKRDGRLWCLRGMRAVAEGSIQVARPEQLSDCGFSPDGATLLAGANAFGDNLVWRVDPAAATVTEVGPLGPGFGEVVVAGPDGVVYRFSDLGGSPSLAGKFRCTAAAR